MKNLAIVLSLIVAAFMQNARASTLLPYLEQIRTEIINQQVIASNAPSLDRPLATALRKSRTALERPTPTNLVNDTKTLATLAKTLNKTSVSNVFDPLLRTALSNYVGVAEDSLLSISNSLLTTFPSGPHTAANNLIGQAFDSLEAALTTVDTGAAAKALAAVAKKLPAVQKLLVKAANAPAPPVQLKATISSTPEGSFGFQPTPAKAAVAALIGNTLQITGVQVQRIGTTSVRNRTLTIDIPNISDGSHVYAVGGGGSNATVIYTVAQGGLGAPPSGDAYTATSGTLSVTYNSATRAAVGTFTFSGPGQNNPGNTASSDDGVFSVVAQ